MKLTVADNEVYAYTGGKNFDPNLPTIVFIHGGEQDHSAWALQSRYMAHHGYGVLAVDLPGHGRSKGAALSRIEEMADWIVALLAAAGVRTAIVIGHSMGSLVALEAAARFPDRISAMVLLGTAFPMRVSPELLEASQRDEPAAQNMINIWSHAAYAHYPGSPGPGAWVAGANLRVMQRQKPGVLHTDFAACNNYKAGLERAAQVRCPTLLLLARHDLMTPARAAQDIAKAITGAKIVMIPGSGHNLMAEKPDEVLDALIAFLRDK